MIFFIYISPTNVIIEAKSKKKMYENLKNFLIFISNLNNIPRPYPFVNMPAQSNFLLVLLNIVNIFYVKILKQIKFLSAHGSSYLNYKQITIKVNYFVFFILYIVSFFLSIFFICCHVINIIYEIYAFILDPFNWILNHYYSFIIVGILAVFSSKSYIYFLSVYNVYINYGFKYVCEAIYLHLLYHLYLYVKPFISLYTSLLMLYFFVSYLFLLPLLLLTLVFVLYISVLTVFYILIIDKQIINKHPVLCLILLIFCCFLIGLCLVMLIKVSFVIVRDLKNYLLNMNTGNTNNPQSFPHPSSSTGGGIGGGGGGRGGAGGGAGGEAVRGNISDDEEEEKIRQKEIAADLKEVENALKLDASLPEKHRSDNSHLKNIQREYPSYFDEESGNIDDPIEGLKQIQSYLQEERTKK